MSKKVLHKAMRIATVCLVLAMTLSLAVSADMTTEMTYIYNSYGEAVPVPDLFEPVKMVGGEDLGIYIDSNGEEQVCSSFNKPNEMYMTESGELYVSDSYNNRIVVLDSDLNLIRVMDYFEDPTEGWISLFEPSGIFVLERPDRTLEEGGDQIFISDTMNNRILRVNENLEVEHTYFCPDISQFSEDTPFEPTRIVVDKQNNMYVLCRNIYHGMLLFDVNGKSALELEEEAAAAEGREPNYVEYNTPGEEFISFYGAESVYASTEVRMAQMWKSIMSDEAEEGTAQYVPTEMKCMDIDDDGYIYTIAQSHSTLGTKNEMDSIRKLNAKGADILVNKMPTLSLDAFKLAAVQLSMTDLTVDDEGFITIVENKTGKILHFDKEMNLLGMAGCVGYEMGQFKTPWAVEQYGDTIYVLDQATFKITMLKLSEFGEAVHKAVSAYHEGYYDQTIEPWNEVISMSANYEFAYTCLGNAYLNKGDYESALKNFELGRNSSGYNEAYKQLRQIFIREVLIYVLAGLVALIAVLVIVKKIVKFAKRKKGR